MRAGEHHRGQPRVVDALPAPEGVPGGDAALGGGHVNVLGATGDVAGGEYPRVRGALLIVDDDEAPLIGLDPRRAHVQPRCSGGPAGCHEQPVGTHPLPRGGRHRYATGRGIAGFEGGGAMFQDRIPSRAKAVCIT